MDTVNRIRDAQRGRWAVAAMFFVNGFIMGSWAPQIPLLLTRLDITETVLGLLILLFGAGALVAMPWSGRLMARHGSRPVLRFFALAAALGLAAVALAPNLPAAAAAMVFFGGVIGAMDVAMNTNAVAVEKQLGRAVMSSSHGFWSLGGFVGGGLGGVAIAGLGFLVHALLVSAASFVLLAATLPYLVADRGGHGVENDHEPFHLPRNPVVYLVGLIALFSMVPEGAVLDWAALYLRQELGTGIASAGFAFAAFSGAMALMRFMGDAVRNRHGAVATLRTSALIAAAGMLAAGLTPSPWLAIASFAVAGLGIANTVPIAFSAAGNQPGMSSANGMAVVTTMGYAGILLAPSVIGFIGERTGFAPVFIGVAALLVVVALLAPLARSADGARQTWPVRSGPSAPGSAARPG